MGKSGSGKDTILEELCSRRSDYHKIISCTTRPKRDYEKQDVDYHFITDKDFMYRIFNEEMIEATEFNNWHYGTCKTDLVDGINIGIFNPDGYYYLTHPVSEGIKVIGFYIQCNNKERLLRQLNREENPNIDEILRRYSTDENDFIDLDKDKRIYKLYNENKVQFNRAIDYIQYIIDKETK